MKIALALGVAAFAVLLAASISLAPAVWAQEANTPVYIPGPTIPAPVGHRQPRAADIPQTDKSAADALMEKQQADLNRRLRICRGC